MPGLTASINAGGRDSTNCVGPAAEGGAGRRPVAAICSAAQIGQSSSGIPAGTCSWRDSDDDWLAVNTILDESTVRLIIPRLKEAGAQGIVEYPLNKIVM